MKLRFLLFISLVFNICLTAQTDSVSKVIHLEEVVFSASKTEEDKSNVPYTIEVMDSRTIALENPQTSADMLANTGSVMIQKSQGGGGSPIIRGFEANRVLIVIDGVRMNNAIYRGGHLQDVITIDNSMLDRTEIVFGPSSVMYGSDAIGGVMHFYTKKPRFSLDDTIKASATSYYRYASANSEKTGHLDFNLGKKRIASLTSITFSDFDDLRTGNGRDPNPAFGRCEYYSGRNYAGTADSMFKNKNTNIQRKTGYSQVDILEKLLFKVNEDVEIGANIQYSTSSNINRYDRLSLYNGSDLKFAEWYYGPQERFMANLNYTVISNRKLFNSLKLIASYQDISQSRMNRKFNIDNLRSQFENVKVMSFNADFNKMIKEKHKIGYGLEFSYNQVTSTANTMNILTGVEVSPTETRYPNDGSETMSGAVYITHKWYINDKVILSDGLRFTSYSLSANFDTSAVASPFQFPFTSIEQTNNALNGNIGLILKPEKNVRFSLLGSTGFRAPNVDDVSKVFDSAADLLIVPNAELKPEYAYNLEATLQLKLVKNKVKIEGGYYYTLLDNAIITQDTYFEGQDSILFNGTMSKVVTAKNADCANVQGAWGALSIDIRNSLRLKSTINYTLGEYYDSENDTILPMDHIAPMFGQTSLKYHYKKFEGEIYARYSAPKLSKDYAIGKEDNEIYSADPVDGFMPGWTTLNLKAVYHVNINFYINFGVENLFDRHYRVFASGVSSPGRNIMFGIRLKF